MRDKTYCETIDKLYSSAKQFPTDFTTKTIQTQQQQIVLKVLRNNNNNKKTSEN